jgi:ABC-type nitrate/sulfonate/bicarbonate transport system substrate-binding protein
VLAASEKQGVDASGGDFFTTRELLKSRPGQVKALLKAFSEAIRMGRENKDLFNRVMRKTMKEENPKVLEALYRSHYFLGTETHNARPLERALDLDIKDLSVTVPELKGRKAADFIDARSSYRN